MPTPKRTSGKRRSPLTSQSLSPELSATGKQLNATNADFLKIDVETALTFSGMALDTDNEEKKQRNRKNARKAYDTILHLWHAVTFTPSQEAHMHEKMYRLKNELARLGEHF